MGNMGGRALLWASDLGKHRKNRTIAMVVYCTCPDCLFLVGINDFQGMRVNVHAFISSDAKHAAFSESRNAFTEDLIGNGSKTCHRNTPQKK